MAPEQEKTYALQLEELNRQIAMLHERMYAERQVISTNTKPISLFASLVSPQFRRTALAESYRSRGVVAELQYRLAEAERQRERIERLQEQFPEHDALIERKNRQRMEAASVALQLEELHLEKQRKLLDTRLQAKYRRDEQRALEREQEELARRQRELDRRRNELNRRRNP